MHPTPSPLGPPLTKHRAAVREYIAQASKLDSGVWLHPIAPGKWSPAQITQHVTLGIEMFTDDLAGGTGMALRLSPWRRFVLRTFMLPRLLRKGQYPGGTKAPREIRPSDTPATQPEALGKLQEAVTALEATVASVPNAASRRLSHAYFGRVPAATAIDLLALHARHHMAQLPHAAPRAARNA